MLTFVRAFFEFLLEIEGFYHFFGVNNLFGEFTFVRCAQVFFEWYEGTKVARVPSILFLKWKVNRRAFWGEWNVTPIHLELFKSVKLPIFIVSIDVDESQRIVENKPMISWSNIADYS